LEEKVREVKEALWKADISKDELESKTKELSDELMKVGQKLYSQPGNNPNEATSNEQKSDDWVVDWEVETEGNTTRV
jgi:molecular chaperone DnaK